MKRASLAASLLLVLFVALATPAFSSDGVKIVDVGLQGYYFADMPVIVRVIIIHADPQPATVELRVRVHSAPGGQFDRIDTFTQTVNLGPNDHQVVGVPVILFRGGKSEVEAQLVGKNAGVLANNFAPLSLTLNGNLIAILCANPSDCQQAQSQIMFSGDSQDQSDKGKTLKFAAVQNPPPEWLGYAPARTVVLATPVALMSPAQQAALEGFVRQGGALIIVEDRPGNSNFLPPYRTSDSAHVPAIVGRGKVFRVASLTNGDLGNLYAGGATLASAIAGWRPTVFVGNELDWTRSRLTTHFRFPSLTWLLIWLGAYILVAGIGNFMVLRLLDRREWGWVTLPSLSLLFAFAMYFTSATNRPRQFLAEDVAFNWMDDQSSLAAVEHGIRISASRRHAVELSMASDGILGGDRNGTGNRIPVNPFEDAVPGQGLNHWDVKNGPPVDVALSLLQWSYRDLEFYGFERMPGTVHFSAPGHLRNETGKNFTQALYVDEDAIYHLGPVLAGADVDLSAARHSPFDHPAAHWAAAVFLLPSAIAETNPNEAIQSFQPGESAEQDTDLVDLRDISKKPFDIGELIYAWPAHGGHVFKTRSGIFFGFAGEPDPPGSLSGVNFARKGYSVTVVSFGRKP